MESIIILIHVVVCVALILIVLLQKGKGAGMGAAFGGSTQTVFGSRGATPFLGKVTVAVAVTFMLTSLGLSFLSGQEGKTSIMEDVGRQEIPASQSTQAPQEGHNQDASGQP